MDTNRNCPYCGEPLSEGALECPVCGEHVSPAEPATPAPAPQPAPAPTPQSAPQPAPAVAPGPAAPAAQPQQPYAQQQTYAPQQPAYQQPQQPVRRFDPYTGQPIAPQQPTYQQPQQPAYQQPQQSAYQQPPQPAYQQPQQPAYQQPAYQQPQQQAYQQPQQSAYPPPPPSGTAGVNVYWSGGQGGAPEGYPKADLGKRFVAYLIDCCVSTAMGIPSIISFFIGYAVMLNDYYLSEKAILCFVVAFVLYFIPLIYWCIKDGLERSSYGKRAMYLRVVKISDGSPCTKGMSFLRALLTGIFSIIIPYVSWLVDPIMVLVRRDGRKLADLCLGLQVVSAEEE